MVSFVYSLVPWTVFYHCLNDIIVWNVYAVVVMLLFLCYTLTVLAEHESDGLFLASRDFNQIRN